MADLTPYRLSSVERLTLINQFEMLAALDPDNGSYREYVAVLEAGYVLEYGRIFDRLHDEMNKEACDEVVNILEMYRELKSAYNQLNDADREKIGASKVCFKGFDGNNESQQYGYVRLLVETLGTWNEYDGADLNSHCPLLRFYRWMLQRWQERRLSGEDLTLADLQYIVEVAP